MIRGAVEQVVSNRVSGWVYSPIADLKGSTLLAFVDDVCVGAGQIDVFRQDLADAGLGDGRFGYSFAVSLNDAADSGRLVVKLEGSDALLKQGSSRVQSALLAAPAAPVGTLALPAPVLHWMRNRAWLGQSDYDFLRYFSQLGIYDRTLTMSVERPDRIDVELKDPAEAAADILGLVCMRDPQLIRMTVETASDIADLAAANNGPGTPPIVALWARERARLDVIEGSHLADAAGQDAAPARAAVEYSLGPDRLLFLDTRCTFGTGSGAPASGIDVFLVGGA
ncbi:hypothetical protein [Roseococcus sp.]|uniref:hypothetical protein n=1 Tax=Roseococcus sp. TaxID=2109646 RepID=UPI003BA931F3